MNPVCLITFLNERCCNQMANGTSNYFVFVKVLQALVLPSTRSQIQQFTCAKNSHTNAMVTKSMDGSTEA